MDRVLLPPGADQRWLEKSAGHLRVLHAGGRTPGRASVMRNDLTDGVHEIAAPTLVFHGEDDPMVDPAGSRRAAERMPDARLILVRDCGHWDQLEQHDRFLAEVRAFLAGLE